MDHRAELFKVLDTLSEDYGISFKHRNDLYFKLFPKNNFQNVEFVSSATDNKDSKIISIISTYNDLNQWGQTRLILKVGSFKLR